MSGDFIFPGYKADASYGKLEKLFKEFFSFNKNISADFVNPWQPPTDVYETPDDVVVKMSIPGAKPEDIRIVFSDDTLTVGGVRNDTTSHEKICFYQVEIRYGCFERSVYIPKPIDANAIKATYKEGFLQVVLPKSERRPAEAFSIQINFR